MSQQMRDRSLYQFFTPEWAAEELVAEFFPDLAESDLVLEPSCGRGAFLKAVPSHVPAIGVEIDPQLAEEAAAMWSARRRNGWQVLLSARGKRLKNKAYGYTWEFVGSKRKEGQHGRAA